jgi:quercetin dioxygenase-like cupin family protein
MKWTPGRQGTGYSKITLLKSKLFKCDAYVLKIPKGVAIPKHTDPVPHAQHFRVNVTLRGDLFMQASAPVFRLGRRLSFFRPDTIVHWADAPTRTTYMFSFGYTRPQ